MAGTRFRFVSFFYRGFSSASSAPAIGETKIPVSEIRAKRVSLFENEVRRQQASITRLEKIEVNYKGLDNVRTTLVMNKDVSTPYNCAQHIGELYTKHSVIAEVNGELWDMHRPLPSDCTLCFINMKVADQHQASLVNKVFWRSCSFLLGAVVENAFKENVNATLHSFPSANVRSGSFVHDVHLSLQDWHPSQNDLRQLAAAFQKFVRQNQIFQRLSVNTKLASEIFEDNPYKTEQIPKIAAESNDGSSVTLYRVGDHIDISRGPMISSTSLVGRCSFSAVHPLGEGLYRFQGVALPSDFYLNHFAFGVLEARAKKLNPARKPEMQS